MDRSLPYDLSAERAALGALLIDREAIVAVAPWLTGEHFYLEKHAWVYEAVLACYAQRVPPDLTTVADELRRRERLDLVGGFPFLSDLTLDVPTAMHIEYYAQIVERTAILRRLIQTGGQISSLGYNEQEELSVTLDAAEQVLFAVTQRRMVKEYAPLSTAIQRSWARLSHLQQHGGELSGVCSGYYDLDAMTGGFQRADLILLAARPGVGKTALALSIAYAVARGGGRVGVVSMEMSVQQLTDRLLALHAGVDLRRIRTGSLRDDEIGRLGDACGVLAELPIFIDDTGSQRIADIKGKARRLYQQQGGIDLLLVDYIQLADGAPRKDGNRVQEVAEISRGLKALAKELDIPIIALSQLSRAVEGRQSHVPMLSDLRESGSLEQDADLVLFIYREEMYDQETDKKGIAEIHIAKHRNGPLGVVPLRFEAYTTRFWNLDRYHSPDGY